MHQDSETPDSANSSDQLAWLVLRLVAEHSPCTKTSLVGYVSGEGAGSDHSSTAPDSHTGKLISDVLRKLKARGFIAFAQEQISITEEGKRFLEELQIEPSQPRARYPALLQTIQTWLAKYTPRLKRFGTDAFARVRAATRRSLQIGVRARDIAHDRWKRKIAPSIGPAATALGHALTRFARVSRARLAA